MDSGDCANELETWHARVMKLANESRCEYEHKEDCDFLNWGERCEIEEHILHSPTCLKHALLALLGDLK